MTTDLMTFSLTKLEDELTRDEGRRASPYKDVLGNDTVGIGHNLVVHPLSYTYPLTDALIDVIFKNDIIDTVIKLDKFLPWWRRLNDARQRVLINMTFNMGIGVPGGAHGLLSFRNFLAQVQAANYEAAASMMLQSHWASQVGQRANRLSDLMRADAPAQKIAPQVKPLEGLKMNLSLLSIVLKFLPDLSALEQDIEAEVKLLSSSQDGKTKILQTIAVLEDVIARIKKALGA